MIAQVEKLGGQMAVFTESGIQFSFGADGADTSGNIYRRLHLSDSLNESVYGKRNILIGTVKPCLTGKLTEAVTARVIGYLRNTDCRRGLL